MYLLDTNVIIYYLRNERDIVRYVEDLLLQDTIITSVIVEAELLSWPKLTITEMDKIVTALETISVIPVDSQIARLAGSFRRQFEIHLLDAIIAATSMRMNATLITRNVKDFEKIPLLRLKKV